jgi:ribonuclease R
VVRVVGAPGDPLVEVLAVAYAAGFSEDFPALPLKEAERIPDEVQRAELAGRRDLRALPLVTIDGEDARDFDDAVFV